MPRLTAEGLIKDLDEAFGHVHENNRDIICDEVFTLQEVQEEIHLAACVDYIVAYLRRNGITN